MINFRAITIGDYPDLEKFWEENYKVSKRDDLEHMKIFLDKNPDLSTLAEENGKIIGTTLGSFDGRKGYIQKVAVHKDYQSKGLGKKLVLDVIEKLKRAGALDIRVGCGEKLVPFYEKCGFSIDGIVPMKIKNY